MNESTLKLLKDFLAKLAGTSGKSGFTQEEHAAFVMNVICENILTDATPEQKKELYTLLYPILNGSALRQRAEKNWAIGADGKIDKDHFMVVSTVKRGGDAAALANKWIS